MKTSNLDNWFRVTAFQANMLGMTLAQNEILLVNRDLATRVKSRDGNKNFYLQFYYNAQNEFTPEQLQKIKRANTKWLVDNYEKNIII